MRVTSESLLSEMLGNPSSTHELFEWLRELSFIKRRRRNLSADLAREALAAELRWRNPDWYKELHKRARHYYSARVAQTHGLEQQRLLYDFASCTAIIPSFARCWSGSLAATSRPM